MNSVVLNGNNVKISVSVFLFKEGEVYIAYCPSLDLSGYDVTEENAKVDFEYMLKDWLKTQSVNKTLVKDLIEHGWKIDEHGGFEPKLIELLQKGETSKVIEQPDYRKTDVKAEICGS